MLWTCSIVDMPNSRPESFARSGLSAEPHVTAAPATGLPAYGGGALGSALIPVGAVLGDRYRVVRILGQGGFGRTYLAEDLQRFNESCVLKEFAPQVHGEDNLSKAQRLFEREAGVLYRLNHDQIPRFRELRQTTYNDQPYLLLVQDFVPGWTYRACLEDRQQHGKTLSEAEVSLMLQQLLPVLAYLHGRGVIHRDIAPDNLIQRSADGLPVLIDFGAVKQAAVTVINEISHRSDQGTRLGKLGYAPPEQMQQGAVFPHSDIYALGATALMLLSGEEPHQLMDPETLDWTWNRVIHLSPGFGKVLSRMVALRPRDRYPSAKAVLRDLERLGTLSNRPVPSLRTAQGGFAVPEPTILPGGSPAISSAAPQSAPQEGAREEAARQSLAKTVAVAETPVAWGQNGAEQPVQRAKLLWPGLILVGGLGMLGGVLLWQRNNPVPVVIEQPAQPVVAVPTETILLKPPTLGKAELERLDRLEQRRSDLGIPADFWEQFWSERFERLYPELAGHELTPAPAEEALRSERLALGEDWLEWLSRLTDEQRSRLGSYSREEFEQWVRVAGDRFMSREAFVSLVDLKVSQQLPELLDQGDGAGVLQVERAIASAVVTGLRTATPVANLTVDEAGNAYQRSTLQPGQESVQLVQLKQGQMLRISLNAPAEVKLSLYRPGDGMTPLVSELTNQSWEGRLSESGLYQVRVRSGAVGPVEYGLSLIVE